ncbi:TlpA disulfide reductase family protein [Nocardioides sp. AE5]|uniref:TlpA family protein disulfide reductase n=1 Tax=Nocardioides sp. AE5 TaxID=2962573 RepID=UPI002881726A|nr:TlpA disulfide reductase family protein [Nocardioides sp. AE5]MDT0200535.1 TlpA disulfide reductase family protein [Nocardioides sp. AE5]
MRKTLAAAALALLVLTGCAPTDSGDDPGQARIDVDTPELREMKAQSQIAACVPGDGDHVEGGLPDVTLPCFGGGEAVNLSSLRGPMVVNLWASWCGPCRDEMPIFEEFAQAYAGKVAVLGINYNDTQTTNGMQLALDTGVSYPQLADTQTTLSRKAPLPALQGLPFTILVDADGMVVHQEFVEIKDLAQLEAMVAEHLGVER